MMIEVEECKTAEDVWRLARASVERRKAWSNARKPVQPLTAVVEQWLPQPMRTLSGELAPSPLEMVMQIDAYIRSVTPPGPRRFAIREIVIACARAYGIPVNEITSDRRDAAAVHPRQVAMMLCKTLTQRSLPAIGREIGDRDHTTVLHACRKFEWLRVKLESEMTSADPISLWARRCAELSPIHYGQWGWNRNRSANGKYLSADAAGAAK